MTNITTRRERKLPDVGLISSENAYVHVLYFNCINAVTIELDISNEQHFKSKLSTRMIY